VEPWLLGPHSGCAAVQTVEIIKRCA